MESILLITGVLLTGYKLSRDNEKKHRRIKQLSNTLNKNEIPNETTIYESSKLERAEQDLQERADKIYPTYISNIIDKRKAPANGSIEPKRLTFNEEVEHFEYQTDFTHTNMEPSYRGAPKLTELQNLNPKFELFIGATPSLRKSDFENDAVLETRIEPDAKEIYDISSTTKDRFYLPRNEVFNGLPQEDLDKSIGNIRIPDRDHNKLRLNAREEKKSLWNIGSALTKLRGTIEENMVPFKEHKKEAIYSDNFVSQSGSRGTTLAQASRGEVINNALSKDIGIHMPHGGRNTASVLIPNVEGFKEEIIKTSDMDKIGTHKSGYGSYYKDISSERKNIKLSDTKTDYKPNADPHAKQGAYYLKKTNDRPVVNKDIKQRKPNIGSSATYSFPSRDIDYTDGIKNNHLDQVEFVERPVLPNRDTFRIKTEHATANREVSQENRIDFDTLFKSVEQEPTFIGPITKQSIYNQKC